MPHRPKDVPPPQPRPGDIPWMRLSVASRSGTGALKAVTAAQRLETRGGAFSGAFPAAAPARTFVRRADYLFLRTGLPPRR